VLTWLFQNEKFYGDEDQAEVWRQRVARSTRVLEQHNIREHGVTPVEISEGVMMFSVRNDPTLYACVEEALACVGKSLCVTIDSICFIDKING